MKRLYIIGTFMLILFLSIQSVLAFGVGTDQTPTNPYDPNSANTQVVTTTHKIWNTVSLILRMLAVGSIIVTGIRYMLISPDQKADIKKSLIYLVIGTIIVFCTTELINFVVTAAQQTVGIYLE